MSAPGGVSALGCVSAPRGMSALGVCLLQGVCLLWGVSSPRRVCLLPGGCLLRGVSAPRGMSTPGGVVSQHALEQTPPTLWTESQTPVKTLPWPQLRCGGNEISCQICKWFLTDNSHILLPGTITLWTKMQIPI